MLGYVLQHCQAYGVSTWDVRYQLRAQPEGVQKPHL